MLKYIEEIESMKKHIADENTSEEEREITEVMLKQMDAQLEEFLGIQKNGQKKNN